LNNSLAKTGLVLRLSGSIKGRTEQSERKEEKTQKNRGKTKKTQATHRAKTQTQIRKEKPAPSSVLHHKD
jgi:hypothetical protein